MDFMASFIWLFNFVLPKNNLLIALSSCLSFVKRRSDVYFSFSVTLIVSFYSPSWNFFLSEVRVVLQEEMKVAAPPMSSFLVSRNHTFQSIGLGSVSF